MNSQSSLLAAVLLAAILQTISAQSTQEMQSEPYVLKKDEGEIITDRQGRTNIVKVSPKTGSRFLAMGNQRLPAVSRIMVHKHDNTEEILYVNEGSGTLLLDDRRINVEADYHLGTTGNLAWSRDCGRSHAHSMVCYATGSR